MSDGGIDLKDKNDIKIEPPSMYKVLFLNDDYTPMDFVTLMLQKYFGKPLQEAISVMMEVHQKGRGIAGIYTYDIAKTKLIQVKQNSKGAGYPLKITLEQI